MNKSFALKSTVAGVTLAALFLTGCADMSERQRGTAQGAGIGAIAGAVLSSATGGKAGTGALIGGGRMYVFTTRVEVSRTADDQLKLNIPNDVSFDTGSASIRPAMRNVLDPFAGELRGDRNSRISIIGHTDSTGSDAINNPLSVQRAESVRDYLVTRGVPSEHVQTAGRGEREPVADNATDAGRARNRRVEIFLREPSGS